MGAKIIVMKNLILFIYIVFLSFSANYTYSQSSLCTIGSPGYEKTIGSIEYAVYYKTNGNSADLNKLTRPFVVLEGFDPINNMEFSEIYEQLNDEAGFLQVLRSDGYDVVIVNLKKNRQSIIYNAQNFKDVIEYINSTLEFNQSLHRIKLCGISMGGLISRLALAEMEKDGYDHRVELFISYDSPHKGANVPLALQAMSDFLNGHIPTPDMGLIPDYMNPIGYLRPFMLEWLSGQVSEAAIQMANPYITTNTLRENFLNRLDFAGNYPEKSRNVAVSFGSDAVKQDHIDKGQRFFKWEGGACVFQECVDVLGLGNICVEWCPTKVISNCYAMPGRAIDKMYFRGALTLEPAPTVNKLNIINPINQINYSFDRPDLNWPDIDHAPGSYYNYSMLSDFADAVNSGIPGVEWNGDNFEVELALSVVLPVRFFYKKPLRDAFGYVENTATKICFVPVISALDINTSNYFYNVRSIARYPYPHNTDITPFDAIHCLNVNKDRGELFSNRSGNINHAYHAYMPNNETADFLLEEVSPDNIYIQNISTNADYTNKYEARGNIVVGNNYDPVPNRTDPGDVTLQGNIILSAGQNGSIEFLDGADLTASTLVLETVSNTLQNTPRAECNSTKIDNFASNPSAWNTWRKNINYENEEVVNNQSKPVSNNYEVYPNPGSDVQTNLVYELIEGAEITVIIQDALGREVATLLKNNHQIAGKYTYNFNNSSLKDGLYLINFVVDGNRTSVKFILKR